MKSPKNALCCLLLSPSGRAAAAESEANLPEFLDLLLGSAEERPRAETKRKRRNNLADFAMFLSVSVPSGD